MNVITTIGWFAVALSTMLMFSGALELIREGLTDITNQIEKLRKGDKS